MAQQSQDIDKLPEILQIIQKMEVPIFPIKGRDLIALGLKENSQIGVTLKKLENEWIESGFSLGREDLLKKAN